MTAPAARCKLRAIMGAPPGFHSEILKLLMVRKAKLEKQRLNFVQQVAAGS